MDLQPAGGDGEIERRLVFSWRGLQIVQKRPVDLLDMDSAFLHGLNRVGDLD